MRAVSQDATDAGSFRHLDYAGRVGRHHQLFYKTMLQYALDDPGDQRLTCQRLERFMGEAGGAETSRNHAQDAHHRS
jgi:hypothetical protein